LAEPSIRAIAKEIDKMPWSEKNILNQANINAWLT